MKLNFKTLPFLLTAGALLLGQAQSASAQERCLGRGCVTPKYYSEPANVQYDDVMAWCQNFVSDLEQARAQADVQARVGGVDSAADILYTKLINKRVNFGYQNPSPNTVDAIGVSVGIANEVMSASQDPGIPARVRGQVRYIMMDSLYELVINTYYQLDQNYYRQVVDVCGHGCYEGGLPPEYYDAVRKLALSFLDLQVKLAPLEATDAVELRVARAVTAGAHDALLDSVLRRSLACPIAKLSYATNQIDAFINGGGGVLNGPEEIQIVRGLVENARNSVQDAECHGFGYGYEEGR